MSRRRDRSVIAASLAVVIGVLSACAAVPSAQDVRGAQMRKSAEAKVTRGTNGANMPVAPDRYYHQSPAWTSCGPGGTVCATVDVPLDYEHPDTSIAIAVLKVPARDPDHRIGSLVVNPGGPGGSGVEYARYASQILGTDVVDRYDTVGFDPRGVGRSPRVRCVGDAGMRTWLSMDVTPDDDAEVDRLQSFLRRFDRACARHTGDLLGHVSTLEAAADMDIIRAALGEQQLDYLGKSYGTLLGATYAQEFPARVGRMVLDGALPGPTTDEDLGRTQAAGFETALDAFLDDCREQPDCPFTGTRSEARREIADFLGRLDEHPLPTTTSRVLTEQQGETGLVQALYAKGTWAQLRADLTAALERGDGSGLLRLADLYAGRVDDSYRESLLVPNVAINCLDSGTEDTSVAAIEHDLPAFEKAAPIFGRSVAWSSLICNKWPVEAAFASVPLEALGAAPIVVIGTTRDPATPYAWAQQLADSLDSAVLLTYEGDGHTAYHEGSTCIDRAVEAFLLDGTVPDRGTTCR